MKRVHHWSAYHVQRSSVRVVTHPAVRSVARHVRPERIIIDGSQTNNEAIISCDGESRRLDRSRRS